MQRSDDEGANEVAPPSRFIDTDADVQIDPATLPENVKLMRQLRALREAASQEPEYEVVAWDQAGAKDLLDRIGALDEITFAVLGHAYATAPKPTYRPQAIKKLLCKRGWVPEVRVPPFDDRYDELPINDRYDLYKVFDDGDHRVASLSR